MLRRRGTGGYGRVLADHWPGLHLAGQAAIAHELLAGFPAEARAAVPSWQRWPRLTSWHRGRWRGRSGTCCWPSWGRRRCRKGRREQALVLLGVVRLLLARQRGDLPAVAEEAQRLQALAEASDAAQPGLGEELRALALISLGLAEFWADRLGEAERHLGQGVALAHQIGRPFLEFTGLACQAGIELFRSLPGAAERSRQAIELAQRHGWTNDPAACNAYVVLAAVLASQGRLDEAAAWATRAERVIRPEAEPAVAMGIYHVRGMLELARDRAADAWPRVAPPNGWPDISPRRTCSRCRRAPTSCTPWCGSARAAALGRFSLA